MARATHFYTVSDSFKSARAGALGRIQLLIDKFTVDIRPGILPNTGKVTISEASGLLFYYLFDDWYTTYALVARREQQYAVELERLVKIDTRVLLPIAYPL